MKRIDAPDAYYPGEEPETGEIGLIVSVNEEFPDRQDVWELTRATSTGDPVINSLAVAKTEEDVKEILSLEHNQGLDVRYLDSPLSLVPCVDRPVEVSRQMAAEIPEGGNPPQIS